jgi:uncharacterized membrane protein YedE/YeeE
MGGPLDLTPSRIERKHVTGGVVFGLGWAVTGTCPAPALAMVGSGGLLGLFVAAGIFSGLMLRDAVVDRAASKPSRGQVQSKERGRPLSQRPVPVDL